MSARNLDSRGVKANLVSRLQNALEEERKAEMIEQKPMAASITEEAEKISGKNYTLLVWFIIAFALKECDHFLYFMIILVVVLEVRSRVGEGKKKVK